MIFYVCFVCVVRAVSNTTYIGSASGRARRRHEEDLFRHNTCVTCTKYTNKQGTQTQNTENKTHNTTQNTTENKSTGKVPRPGRSSACCCMMFIVGTSIRNNFAGGKLWMANRLPASTLDSATRTNTRDSFICARDTNTVRTVWKRKNQILCNKMLWTTHIFS